MSLSPSLSLEIAGLAADRSVCVYLLRHRMALMHICVDTPKVYHYRRERAGP